MCVREREREKGRGERETVGVNAPPTYHTLQPVQPPPPEDVEGGKDKVQSVPSQSSASNRWFWGWSGRRQNADGKGTPVDKQETMGEGSDGEVGTIGLCVRFLRMGRWEACERTFVCGQY